MKRTLAYPLGLLLAAGKCDPDSARTPASSARESNPRGVMLHTRGGRQYVVRTVNNEGIAIARNARWWVA